MIEKLILWFKNCLGSEMNINKALKLIRNKFPERAYPEFTLECVTPLMMESSTLVSQLLKVKLVNESYKYTILLTFLFQLV